MASPLLVPLQSPSDLLIMKIQENATVEEIFRVVSAYPEVLSTFNDQQFVQTFLHVVVELRRANLALELLGLQPNLGFIMDREGRTPIHLAISSKQYNLAKLMVGKNTSLIRAKGLNQDTPLHLAVSAGNVDFVKFLIDECPEAIGDVNSDGETPLFKALRNRTPNTFRMLLKGLEKSRKEENNMWKIRALNVKNCEEKSILHLMASNPRLLDELEILWNFNSKNVGMIDLVATDGELHTEQVEDPRVGVLIAEMKSAKAKLGKPSLKDLEKFKPSLISLFQYLMNGCFQVSSNMHIVINNSSLTDRTKKVLWGFSIFNLVAFFTSIYSFFELIDGMPYTTEITWAFMGSGIYFNGVTWVVSMLHGFESSLSELAILVVANTVVFAIFQFRKLMRKRAGRRCGGLL